ncbi:MAG: DNA polymerase [Treponema sp.]|nr:DNA polymerase [Treponema sp.]
MEQSLVHLNAVGFQSTIAVLFDHSLRGRPFIIPGRVGGQAVAADVSPAAIREGIVKGMALSHARRLVKDLVIAEPNPSKRAEVNKRINEVISRYAPAWQNDGAGNIFLDITGTRRIFGPAPDCVCHIQNEIMDRVNISAAAAAGTTKLVCKVASRTIRPEGLIEIRSGEEESFLSRQDIALLPGLGPSLMKTIRVTGFSEIGDLARLSDSEALSLFGKKGILLRDSARGIDNSPVCAAKSRVIESRVDFSDDVLDEMVLRGSLVSLAEHCGLNLRRDKFGSAEISLKIFYSDGVTAEGREKTLRLCFLDRDIALCAQRILKKTVQRRVRIRSVSLSLEKLLPLSFEPDLFEPETEIKNRDLQAAADSIQIRYGEGKVTRGIVLAASANNMPRKKYPRILCGSHNGLARVSPQA